jgi:hypothetical protein
MLTRTIGRYLSWPIDRLAALLAPTGIPPNVITWLALVLNLWAGILFAAGRFAAGGGMMILAGLCDLLDGKSASRCSAAFWIQFLTVTPTSSCSSESWFTMLG